jgi:DNA-binding NarL/FixJ family response regulator
MTSPAESKVLSGVNRIAKELVVSAKTGDNHIQYISEKLGISSRAAATLFAVENQLV